MPSRVIGDFFFACSSIAGKKAFGRRFLKKGFIINNAFEQEKFSFNADKRKEIRTSLGIDEKTVIGHVGNMTPPKNHMFLLDVFCEYLKYNSDSVLLLVGTGYLKKEIIKKSNELGFGDRVIMIGLVDNVQDYLSAMDFFVFPSRFEGLGIAFVEAQINGLKCIVSKNVPQEANINGKNNAFLSIKRSPKIWAKKLDELSGRVELPSYTNEFDIHNASLRLEGLYQQVIRNEKESS